MNKPTKPAVRSRINRSGTRSYFIDYYHPETGVRMREVVGPRKDDATRRSVDVYNELIAVYVGEPTKKASEISLPDLVEAFMRAKKGRVSDATMTRYNILSRHFVDFMARAYPTVERVRDIRRATVEEFLEAMREGGQEPKTLNVQLYHVKALFKHAVEEGLLAENPAYRIKPFRNIKVGEAAPYWTEDEVHQILGQAEQPYRDIYEFLYYTGLRKAELMYLTWNDVNLKGPAPTITVQAKEGWSPKTMKRRIIPLNEAAVAIIKRQSKSPAHNYVFTGVEGGQVHRDRVYHALKEILRDLGLEGDVHQWRHTFASHLVMKGVGIETVSKLLGHTTIEMTMKYAHLAPDHLSAAVKLLQLSETKPLK
ncbi:MAG TPA: tyrosine-type recombinase/integrase [bacterium]|jgi:integrase